MEENKKSRIAEISIHPFKPLPGAPEGGSQILGQESKETITTTEVKVYTSKAESDLLTRYVKSPIPRASFKVWKVWICEKPSSTTTPELKISYILTIYFLLCSKPLNST